MPRITLGPGEENLAIAFETIGALQRQLVRLSQKVEIDGLVIATLLGETTDGQGALQRWRAISATYYPSQAIRNAGFGEEPDPHLSQDLNDRIAYWTKAFESRSQRSEE